MARSAAYSSLVLDPRHRRERLRHRHPALRLTGEAQSTRIFRIVQPRVGELLAGRCAWRKGRGMRSGGRDFSAAAPASTMLAELVGLGQSSSRRNEHPRTSKMQSPTTSEIGFGSADTNGHGGEAPSATSVIAASAVGTCRRVQGEEKRRQPDWASSSAVACMRMLAMLSGAPPRWPRRQSWSPRRPTSTRRGRLRWPWRPQVVLTMRVSV